MSAGRDQRSLSERVERELDNDRRFFRRHPQRRHYVRRIYEAERTQFECVSGTVINTTPTIALYVAVALLRLGARARAPFVAEANLETDLPESVCVDVFEAVAPQWVRRIREQLRREAGE